MEARQLSHCERQRSCQPCPRVLRAWARHRAMALTSGRHPLPRSQLAHLPQVMEGKPLADWVPSRREAAPCWPQGPRSPGRPLPSRARWTPKGTQASKDTLHVSGAPSRSPGPPLTSLPHPAPEPPPPGLAAPALPGEGPALAVVTAAPGGVGVGVGTGQGVGAELLREVLQEDGRLQLLHLHVGHLEGPLAGHGGRQGVAPLQEGVHLAEQASGPLGARGSVGTEGSDGGGRTGTAGLGRGRGWGARETPPRAPKRVGVQDLPTGRSGDADVAQRGQRGAGV